MDSQSGTRKPRSHVRRVMYKIKKGKSRKQLDVHEARIYDLLKAKIFRTSMKIHGKMRRVDVDEINHWAATRNK